MPHGRPPGGEAGASGGSASRASLSVDLSAGRGRSAAALAAEAVKGTTVSRIRVAPSGSGSFAASGPAAAPSKGSPVRSPRRCRKTRSATTEPSVQATAVEMAASTVRRAGPSPTPESPALGLVPGSVRATATAKYAVAVIGATHQARRAGAGARVLHRVRQGAEQQEAGAGGRGGHEQPPQLDERARAAG
ncbi:hypothetical protein SALBM135S_09861 [Streptomyces alboniger]